MSCSTQQCRVRRLLPFALPPESELRSAMRSASATTSELQEGRSEWWSTSVVEVRATKCKCEMATRHKSAGVNSELCKKDDALGAGCGALASAICVVLWHWPPHDITALVSVQTAVRVHCCTCRRTTAEHENTNQAASYVVALKLILYTTACNRNSGCHMCHVSRSTVSGRSMSCLQLYL